MHIQNVYLTTNFVVVWENLSYLAVYHENVEEMLRINCAFAILQLV